MIIGGKEMNSKLFTMLGSVVIAFSGIAGYATVIKADTNDRYDYSFYNMDTQGHSYKQEKATNRKVYIHPTSGPGLKYRVQGSATGNGWTNRSSQKTIYSGSSAKLANDVYDHGEIWARLQLVRTTTGYTHTYGKWNPDPM